MCWFISVGVPKTARNELERLSAEFGRLQFRAFDSSPTAAVFGQDYLCMYVTHGGCSCDLMLRPTNIEMELDKQRARLSKKGLSASRIQSALDSKAHVLSARTALSDAQTQFIAAISALATRCAGARVYAHSYRGGINDEAVPAPGKAVLDSTALADLGIPADTLIEFRAVG